MNRVVTLPNSGTLIVATDLQGHVEDFIRISQMFESILAATGDAQLVITGDLVHGPEISHQQWPDNLGSYYWDESPRLIDLAWQLQSKHPGRVHYLLGNHEYCHLGGPVAARFFANEGAHLEMLLGAERSQWFRSWLSTWPVMAVAEKAGIVLSHAAPAVAFGSRSQIEALDPSRAPDAVILDRMLWGRTRRSDLAWHLFDVLGIEGQVLIHGHDVAPEGHRSHAEPLLCLSSSFGLHEGDKTIALWPLDRAPRSAAAFATEALIPLHPSVAPVWRRPPMVDAIGPGRSEPAEQAARRAIQP